MNKEIDKNSLSLAGEFYVLAQLSQRELIATLTLGHTKSIDILVSNQKTKKVFKVEVKTTRAVANKENLFGNTPFYFWVMGEKHETIIEKNLLYVFVLLQEENVLPKFFIVPSKDVAKYVKWQHEKWKNSRTKDVNSTKMRKFRIMIDDKKYENNWGVFKK